MKGVDMVVEMVEMVVVKQAEKPGSDKT